MSIRGDVSSADVVVSQWTPGIPGADWTPAVIAIKGDNPTVGDFPDKPWLGVHAFDATQASRVYVTTTNFRGNGNCDIVFSASADSGATFPNAASPVVLESSTGCDPVLQGSNVTGGQGGSVLACWYHSGADGWLSGGFNIRCSSSTNNGGTWSSPVAAVVGILYETPYWLCPTDQFYRVWAAMFPQVRISPDGKAHVVFTRDPTAGSGNGECGDIAYIRSDGPPYNVWSSPVKISSGNNTNKTAQNFATISIEARTGSPGYRLYVAWVDQRNTNRRNTNFFYDIYTAYSDNGGSSWSSNSRLTTNSSLTDWEFIGDYIDAASTTGIGLPGTGSPCSRAIWTDRRDKTSYFDIFDPEDDVFQNPIILCP